MRHGSRVCSRPRRCRTATAPMPSPAPRSSSPPASTTWRRTSSIWCSPASRARPQGTKGISLFVVPKLLVNGDGSLGERNGVACGSLEHKMGIHGNATCVMNYDGAKGWLVGEENRGLNAMFVMMNEARLAVGVQGLAPIRGRLSERGGLREGPPAGPRAHRREVPRQAGRPDHRASGRAPHASVHQGLQRGGARAHRVDGAQERHRAPLLRRGASARSPRTTWA